MGLTKGVLTWLHIGDLHISDEAGRNLHDLRRIVTLANGLPHDAVDFVVLPGDNAEDGTETQFGLVRDAVAPLRLPLHILPGDHDFKTKSLDAFHRLLGAPRLPYAITVKGRRCRFLDVVSAGQGGPDFRLDQAQLDWLEREIMAAEEAVLFMHAYSADLHAGADRLCALLGKPQMCCVDMGHTHYNELANDGGTIFMATRSTGQAEEGPPGFSIAVLDGDCLSWRFKTLDHVWPCVVVTQPADRRLVTSPNGTNGDAFVIRATVLGDAPIMDVEVSVAGSHWAGMLPDPHEAGIWQSSQAIWSEHIRVRARDAFGRVDEDQIEPPVSGPTPGRGARDDGKTRQRADGSDRDRIGAWLEKDILGTQRGPNCNGRQW